ncbi:TetR/AcrR family transcriptional regulator [Arthrobacter sp. NicSoilB11]|jgi:AcrR family transcriptional regulator|uniref:TetR/AcrR family transcriptional regulator n=1 Tax=Micrococcaceae TaxID=1268 RepID=UPI001CC33F3C|nr:TetR/AcrR family transcriptional regulator [Arthrobacter sp. NicSoilB11]BCW77911.1 TetR family transcriptional regulator [Arthrobacter sp. NicSoilB11]
MSTKTPRRGEYAKTAQRRQQIVDAASVIFAKVGFLNASLGEIASLAGMSVAGLNHHFPTKTLLLEAVFEQRDAEAETFFEGGKGLALLQGLIDVAERDQANPSVTRFFAIMSAEATAGDHPANEYFGRRYEAILSHVEGAFRDAQEEGALRPGIEPIEAARAYVALSDGLQVQGLYQPGAFSLPQITRKLLESFLIHPLSP